MDLDALISKTYTEVSLEDDDDDIIDDVIGNVKDVIDGRGKGIDDVIESVAQKAQGAMDHDAGRLLDIVDYEDADDGDDVPMLPS